MYKIQENAQNLSQIKTTERQENTWNQKKISVF